MSVIAVAVKHMMEAGMPAEAIVAAVAAMEEQVQPKRSAGAVRQQRYRERHKASQSVTSDESNASDESDSAVTLLPLEGSSPTPPSPKTPSSIPPSPPKGGSSPAEFEKFWEAFPSKVGKLAARSAFAKARRRVDFETIMAAVDRYAHKTDDRPWCNPSTWLNQGRWEDGPPAAPGSKPQAETPQVDWLARVQHFRKHEQWPHGWGPRPEEPGCRALMMVPIGDPLTPFIEKAWGRTIGHGQRTSTVPAWIYDDALKLKQEAQAA